MALIIEDGSLVANANSYATLVEARAYALARGVTLDVDDSVVEVQMIQAMDFIEAQRARFQGEKVSKDQSLQWPREDVSVDGFDYEADEIPRTLKDAQCQLAMDVSAGEDLMPNADGREVIREKVDVLETEYTSQGGPVSPVFRKALSLLEPLFSSATSGVSLMVTRI